LKTNVQNWTRQAIRKFISPRYFISQIRTRHLASARVAADLLVKDLVQRSTAAKTYLQRRWIVAGAAGVEILMMGEVAAAAVAAG
jgi:hypothetical protein